MKNGYILLITLFIFTFSNAQIVDIPDANFKNALVNENVVDIDDDGIGDVNADTNNDGEIQVSEAEAVIGLIIREFSISSLEGLEMFINIEALDCGINNISNLDVSQNTNLKYIDCDSMQLSSLNLSQNVLLEYLDCGLNPILNLDLTQNTNLENLGISATPITEIDVSQNTNLILLFCVYSEIVNLDLSNNSNLEILWCEDTQLSYLNIHNGNNHNMTQMWASENPNLNCIGVDDVNYANNATNWQKDDWAAYSEDCELGIEDNNIINFSLYPNPVQDVLNIEFQPQLETVKIYNLQGQLIKEDSNNSIDLSQLSSGLYIVHVTIEGKTITKKFVKE